MSDEQPQWAKSLSKGELRRLTQHLSAGRERLLKAYNILDEAGVLDEWDGKHGFVYDATSALSYSDDSETVIKERYAARKRNE